MQWPRHRPHRSPGFDIRNAQPTASLPAATIAFGIAAVALLGAGSMLAIPIETRGRRMGAATDEDNDGASTPGIHG